MDLSGVVVNQSCIAVLHKAGDLGRYGHGGYMTYTNAIKKVQTIVYEKIARIVPYKLIDI